MTSGPERGNGSEGLDLRARLAVAAGSLAGGLSRLLGRGGSTLPGEVARRLDPAVLAKLARRHPRGNVLVTGTNGKTTTARLLANVLGAAGWRIAHNRSGANLVWGVTTAFLQAVGVGRPRDLGLAEVDEGNVPRVAEEIRPRAVVVTNFFRDQLDRYGELQHTVDLVRRGLLAMDAGGVAVLNADDPLVAALGEGLDRGVVYYGIDAAAGPGDAGAAQAADARHCVSCGRPYAYTVTRYAHLGDYRCPACGRGRPRPDVTVTEIEAGEGGQHLRIATPAGEAWVNLPLPGLYNAYNAAAAAAAAFVLGVPLATVTQGLETAVASFGRMEVLSVGGRELVIALVKNPAGFNQVLETLLADRGGQKRLLIAINDLKADGTDVSWLWDVDFERLAARADEFAFLGTAGIRAEEMALRLKYAGVPAARLAAGEDAPARPLGEALAAALAATPEGGRLWFLPTYTALMEARRALHRQGAARPFWEA